MHSRAMKTGCAIVFAHTHHHHLDQAATHRAAEIIGVGFYAVQHHNAIGRERGRTGESRYPIDRAPHLACGHSRLNGHLHRFLSDAVIGQNPLLPLGRGATMAAHGRQDKGLYAGRL